MEDKLKVKIKENQVFILSILGTVMFSLIIVFLISSNTGPNKEMKQLESIWIKIDTINQTINSATDNISVAKNKAIDAISAGIIKLKELPIELSLIETTYESTTNIKYELETALSSTITFYDCSIYMINNPDNVVNYDSLSELTSYKEDSLNTYKILFNQGINTSFSNESNICFDNITNYLTSLIKLNKTQNIIDSQKQDFIISLKNLIINLNTLTENLEPALNKIKEDKRDLQVLIDDIEGKELILKDVKTTLGLISIPDGYSDYYTYLDEFLKLYQPYISEFKEALIFDKSCTDKIKNSEKINNNYKNIFSKYQDVVASYSEFKNIINNL